MTDARHIALTVSLVTALSASAQYSLDWHTVAGGGGTSTNGQYSVSGTVGQPDAGMMSGGSYSVVGGFWGIVSAVQTPGAPLLAITHSGSTVKVSWPYPSTGWTLQQNPNLTAVGWSASGGVSNDGTNNFIIVTPPVGNLFFRLKNP